MNLKKKSLSAKFYFVVFLFTVALGINIYLGFSGMGEVRDSLKHIVETVAVRQGKWVEIRDLQRQMVIQERDLMLLKDPAAREEVGKKIDLLAEKVSEVVESYKAIATPEGMAQAEQFGGDFGLWYAEHMMIRMLVSEGQMAEAEHISNGRAQELRDKMGASIDHMTEANHKEMEEAVLESESDYTRVRSLMTLVGAISLFGGVALAWFILRAINGSIDQVIGYLEKNSEQVGLASHQIANASQSLSQASTSQASSLQQTAASIEQLTSMVQRNLESAQRASELSAGSQSNAMKGKNVVEEMSKAISEIDQSNNEIMTQVEDSNRQIGEITKVISEIGEKTKVINDIVFQTRLLSFNASVEAARAGEHGKGFAVVAEEVGNLAQMSGNAAKEISSMLDASIQKVESIVNDTRGRVDGLIQSGKSKVEVGVRIANECGTVLDEIVESVTEVSQVSAGIASASQEQAQGVREISKAMHMLDQVTQTNAAASEQAAGAAEQLSHQADSLKSAVRQLIAAVKGESKAAAASDDMASAAQASSTVTSKSAATPSKSPVKAKSARSEKSPAPAKAAKAEANKVVKFDLGKKKKKEEEQATLAKPTKAEMKKSVGSESDVPAENDPRFRDI